MKPLRDLTIGDFRATPVWKSHGSSDDKAVVEPTSRTTLTETERDTFLALTEFVLANGQRHIGFCSPVDDSGPDYLQPVIMTGRGQVSFWFDEPPASDVLAEQWARLGVPEVEVFPVEYECLVPVDGRKVKGVIASVESAGGAA